MRRRKHQYNKLKLEIKHLYCSNFWKELHHNFETFDRTTDSTSFLFFNKKKLQNELRRKCFFLNKAI